MHLNFQHIVLGTIPCSQGSLSQGAHAQNCKDTDDKLLIMFANVKENEIVILIKDSEFS